MSSNDAVNNINNLGETASTSWYYSCLSSGNFQTMKTFTSMVNRKQLTGNGSAARTEQGRTAYQRENFVYITAEPVPSDSLSRPFNQ